MGRDQRRRRGRPLKSPFDKEEEKTAAFIVDALGIDIHDDRTIILADWFEIVRKVKMAKIERNVVIRVPVEKVFSYISDPMKLLEWLPSLFDIRNVTGEGVDQQFSWTYKMMGIPFKGAASYTEYKPRERIVIETTGNIHSSWTFTFKPQGDMTLANLEINYTIPMPLLGKLGERLILRQNEREAELAVANIKERLEWRDQFRHRNSEKH